MHQCLPKNHDGFPDRNLEGLQVWLQTVALLWLLWHLHFRRVLLFFIVVIIVCLALVILRGSEGAHAFLMEDNTENQVALDISRYLKYPDWIREANICLKLLDRIQLVQCWLVHKGDLRTCMVMVRSSHELTPTAYNSKKLHPNFQTFTE